MGNENNDQEQMPLNTRSSRSSSFNKENSRSSRSASANNEKNSSSTSSSAKNDNASIQSDFCRDFRQFLSDQSNKNLLHEAICGPLLQTIESLREDLILRDNRIEKLEAASADQDDRLCNLESSLETHKKTINKLESHIDSLLQKNDALDQYNRRNTFRVSGIPEEDTENNLSTKVIDLMNSKMDLRPPLDLSDLEKVHRAGKKGETEPRAVIMKFSSHLPRNRILSGRRSLKGTGIFVNEDLTRPRSALLFRARQAKKSEAIKDCWSSDGRIMIRDNDDEVRNVTNESLLQPHLTFANPTNQPNKSAAPYWPPLSQTNKFCSITHFLWSSVFFFRFSNFVCVSGRI